MRFRDDYYFLSNMCKCKLPVEYNGRTYNFSCVESAFQGMKDPSRLSEFEKLNGYDARKLGKHIRIDAKSWNERRDDVMKDLLDIKFRENPWMMSKLKNIKGPITEENSWKDTYWGVCDGVGQNKLGHMLENIRDRELGKDRISRAEEMSGRIERNGHAEDTADDDYGG